MLQQIIDRRLAGKNKSIGNRERFLRRHKEQIREAVKRAVDGRGIRDIAQGEDIHIPKRDISEPVFGHGPGGKQNASEPLKGSPVISRHCFACSAVRTFWIRSRAARAFCSWAFHGSPGPPPTFGGGGVGGSSFFTTLSGSAP